MDVDILDCDCGDVDCGDCCDGADCCLSGCELCGECCGNKRNKDGCCPFLLILSIIGAIVGTFSFVQCHKDEKKVEKVVQVEKAPRT
jgi:hypothetical protein